jgi:hypothetical protein
MKLSIKSFTSGLCLSMAIASVPVLAQDAGDPANISQPEKECSPYVNRDYPQNVYWGDSHLLFPLFSQGTN